MLCKMVENKNRIIPWYNTHSIISIIQCNTKKKIIHLNKNKIL